MLKSHDFQKNLLKWYDKHRRVLPWRALGGEKSDPYRVWLSEIMLQQTTVATVDAYFRKFIKLWPNVKSLANAAQEDVLKEWAGLGYYARARNLHKCAIAVAKEHKGIFPADEEGLRALPGIGPYTAAAIMAIAYNKHAVVIDGNVDRVTTRLFAFKKPMRDIKPQIKTAANLLYKDTKRAGDLAQALMDLGATICIPQKPRCHLCPVKSFCAAFEKNIQKQIPAKKIKEEKPFRMGRAYGFITKDGRICLERRSEDRLLGGMMALPSGGWDGKEELGRKFPPIIENKLEYIGDVYHIFTHFNLKLEIWVTKVTDGFAKKYQLVPLEDITSAGLPTLFKKVGKVISSHEK